MTQFALYYHAGSGNKGCEALVDATSALLHRRFAQTDVCLYSMHASEDWQSDYPFVRDIRQLDTPSSFSLADRVKLKLLQKKSQYDADRFFYMRQIPDFSGDRDRVFLSIGGDTYCYGENRLMYAVNERLKRQGITTVLWGCSLDESSFTPANTEDLRSYDAIFARETGTYSLLREKGFEQNVFLHPDPAFTLRTQMLPLPDGFREGNTIGINASPLVFRYENEARRGVGIRSYEALMEWILRETDQSILLIPHVYWDFSDDRTILRQLYEKYSESGRVLMLDGIYSAPQLKGFIARCRMFIGARTHATIAAYSSLVPTLVLGYSVKSVNIAIDLFGKTDGFVVPVDRLESENGLADAFASMFVREQLHRALLSERVPEYIRDAELATETLENYLQTI